MSEFRKIQDPLTMFPEGYDINNPNIIKRVEQDLSNGNPFHYLFTGVVGCGKTYLAKHIVDTNPLYWKCIAVKPFYETYLKYIQSDYTDKWDAIKTHNREFEKECLFIDDLGDERPGTAASHDYFGGLIISRYIYIQRHDRTRTIITTNLDSLEIENIYGSRATDRLKECFVICKFNPTSFREKKETVIES